MFLVAGGPLLEATARSCQSPAGWPSAPKSTFAPTASKLKGVFALEQSHRDFCVLWSDQHSNPRDGIVGETVRLSKHRTCHNRFSFQAVAEPDSHKNIFAMWHASLDAAGRWAAILEFRASPPPRMILLQSISCTSPM